MLPKNNPTKRLLYYFIGMVISVIPVAVSIFSYFPLWIRRGDASILSGLSLLLIGFALIPLYRHIKGFMRSPSAPTVWLISFVIFLLLSRIADEMTVISFVGFTSNLIGSVFFRLSKKHAQRGIEDEGL